MHLARGWLGSEVPERSAPEAGDAGSLKEMPVQCPAPCDSLCCPWALGWCPGTALLQLHLQAHGSSGCHAEPIPRWPQAPGDLVLVALCQDSLLGGRQGWAGPHMPASRCRARLCRLPALLRAMCRLLYPLLTPLPAATPSGRAQRTAQAPPAPSRALATSAHLQLVRCGAGGPVSCLRSAACSCSPTWLRIQQEELLGARPHQLGECGRGTALATT